MIRMLLAVLALIVAFPVQAADLPKGFVRLADVAPDIRQDMRYATSNNFVGRPIDGYRRGDCWLRREAAEALATVAAKADGWRLVVYDCYRPTRAVADFVAWSRDSSDQKMKAEYYPDIDKSLLFKAGFIATRSEHSRGTTVDIGAETTAGAPLDFGTPFDSFFPESATASTAVGPEAKANRQRLVALMAAAGFENYRKEWWHFTFGMKRPAPQDTPIQ